MAMLREYGVTLKGREYRAIRNGTATAGLVSSVSQPGMWHTIRDGRCDCEGFGYRSRCSHLDALAATALVERWAASRQERDTLAAQAEELAARLDALMGKLAEAQDREERTRREMEDLAGEDTIGRIIRGEPVIPTDADAETPHAESLDSNAA